jgi:hypothetical protein
MHGLRTDHRDRGEVRLQRDEAIQQDTPRDHRELVEIYAFGNSCHDKPP